MDETVRLTEDLADRYVDAWLAHLRQSGRSDHTIERAARLLADAALGCPHAAQNSHVRQFLQWLKA